jgi:hypothetical protein
MINRNKELEKEALETIKTDKENANNKIINDEQSQIEECLKLSKLESECLNRLSENEKIKYQEDLEYAIKLSLMEHVK